MSVAKVLRLEDYRSKKAHRVHLAESLHGADSGRLAIARHLGEISDLCAADRAAVVWIDEYGSGAVHPHVVLDQLFDRPRRSFSPDPLRAAWELGLPGVLDAMADPSSTVPATFAISLGSDGMRSWFLMAESSGGRPLLPQTARERLLFLAGECAAVLLHRDLDGMLPEGAGEPPQTVFTGWRILRDLEGRESDEEQGRRIAQRFVVGRIALHLVEEDLVVIPDRLAEQVRRARAELPDREPAGDEEATLWHATLDAIESRDLDGLARLLVAFGQVVERQEHPNGALELYDCAYGVSVAISDARSAAEALWYAGRLLRRRAEWDRATERYRAAQGIADAAGLADVAVHLRVGLAVIRQDVGNLPAARRGLEEALGMAEASGDRDAVGVVHHAFMGLEQLAGNVDRGLEHGWVAVASYASSDRRMQCMATLAGVLLDLGDWDAAEDAWALVAHESREKYYLVYAYDALAHLAALRGDRESFVEHAARCDTLDWVAGSRWVKAEILFHRGLSYRALGLTREADTWLRQAVAFAEEHGYNRVLFKAEEALAALVQPEPGRATEPTPAAPAQVREGLRAMRQELAGVEV